MDHVSQARNLVFEALENALNIGMKFPGLSRGAFVAGLAAMQGANPEPPADWPSPVRDAVRAYLACRLLYAQTIALAEDRRYTPEYMTRVVEELAEAAERIATAPRRRSPTPPVSLVTPPAGWTVYKGE